MLRSAVLALSATAIAAGLAFTPAPANAQSDPIAERKAVFQMYLRNVRAINAAVQANGDMRALAANVREMQAGPDRVAPLFPAGTGQGQTTVTTRALPVIWTENAGFVSANNGLKPALATLLTAAESGDIAQVRTALGGVDAACSACHTTYRAR